MLQERSNRGITKHEFDILLRMLDGANIQEPKIIDADNTINLIKQSDKEETKVVYYCLPLKTNRLNNLTEFNNLINKQNEEILRKVVGKRDYPKYEKIIAEHISKGDYLDLWRMLVGVSSAKSKLGELQEGIARISCRKTFLRNNYTSVETPFSSNIACLEQMNMEALSWVVKNACGAIRETIKIDKERQANADACNVNIEHGNKNKPEGNNNIRKVANYINNHGGKDK